MAVRQPDILALNWRTPRVFNDLDVASLTGISMILDVTQNIVKNLNENNFLKCK